MKKPHFLCITPYEGMREIFRNIAAIRSDFTCTILLGDYEQGVKIAKENFTDEIDAIISRGETAQLLSNTFSVPIFKIKFSSYDILRALKAAQSISPRFVLVGRPSITKIGQTLCDLLQYTEVKIESIRSVEETEVILHKAKEDGYPLVVGDMRTVNYAQLLNMQSILIMSGVETIEDTLNHAMQTISCMDRYAEQNAVLKKAFSCAASPTAVLNPDGSTYFSSLDRAAASLLEHTLQAQPDLLEQDSTDLVKKSGGTYHHIHGQVFSSGGQSYRMFQVAARPNYLPPSAMEIYNKSDFSDAAYHLSWGHSSQIEEFLETAHRYAQLPTPLLLVSEYGCEIDQLAANLYLHSPYQNQPLLCVNCAKLSDSQLESFFESDSSPLYNSNHMLYIQNIDALPKPQLSKLFSYLEDTQIAGRKKLLLSFQMNSSHVFNQFYNENQHLLTPYFVLRIPPLREHAEDIWEISNLYINSLNLEYGKQIVGIQPEAALQLKKFPWPQNLVQLKQTLRSALIAAYSFYISSKDLSFILNSAATMNTICDSDGGASIDFSRTLHEIEYQIVNHVLRLENNNQTRAAKRLDIVTVKANGE